ncbi:hypothetical protein N3K66_007785 [Trichothecium roseum]|uniref:Uncharacterized protein n=1 Tax=Trichothecium roseum TaxID=47278 RepID=A0ACC0URL3_9HYPO|nr:hypothetical protein N3K66_007785 [Trichothecium roseum]
MSCGKTILVANGEWPLPTYERVDKAAYYAELRKPLMGGGGKGDDRTTANLTGDLANFGRQTAEKVVRGAMRSEHEQTNGFHRCIWVWGMGYVLREKYADKRVVVAVGTGVAELTTTYEQYEASRQELLDYEEEADDLDDSELRACARRSLLEYFNDRTFRRITKGENTPSIVFPENALLTLTIGGNWVGAVYELATMAFPELSRDYVPVPQLEDISAITNTIASSPRDQREGTTNSMISIYTNSTSSLADDLVKICAYLDTTEGPELSLAGHFVAANNNHSRYIMLAVFLAAARHGNVSFADDSFRQTWLSKSLELGDKIKVPEGCLATPRKEWESRITAAVDRMWPFIETANKENTESSIQAAQRALHRFVDEELQRTCWRTADPTVLWATCVALFLGLCKIEGIAELLLEGGAYKSLYVEGEGHEDEWLKEVYASKPEGYSS